ncbi:MAG: hypothetical protein QOD93_5233, partial [Acetobacteraceae bacterium]|nr:hypothetical protein [Acetobacteraceae bacterium]
LLIIGAVLTLTMTRRPVGEPLVVAIAA